MWTFSRFRSLLSLLGPVFLIACSGSSGPSGTGGKGGSAAPGGAGGAAGAGGQAGSGDAGAGGPGGQAGSGSAGTGGTGGQAGSGNAGGGGIGGQVSAVDGGSEATDGPVACGAAPRDPVILNSESTQDFRGSIRLTSSGCTSTVIPLLPFIDHYTINFTDGVAIWIRGDVTTGGYLPFYYPELKPTPTYTDAIGALIWDTASAAALQTLVTSYNPSTMSLISVYSLLNKGGAAAPCNLNDGVTYTVPGHPEAVVAYGSLAHDDVGTLTLGTATDSSGGAFITLLPKSALEYVSVVGTKPGCTVLNSGGAFTGRIPIAPGTTSTALAY